MGRAYSDIAFTPTIRAMQTRMGSRSIYAPLDISDKRGSALTSKEVEFIGARDGFYQASVSETGWPYVQFRGGPVGFLKVLNDDTIGYADFRGNVQYISTGNLQSNDRIALILVDYANRRRLKILGRAYFVEAAENPELMTRLEHSNYRAHVERAVLITVEAYDWNCQKHIPLRYTELEVETRISKLSAEIMRLRTLLDLA